jgi:hypothetical protein
VSPAGGSSKCRRLRQQHRDLEPQTDQAPGKDEQVRGPVAANQGAAEIAHADCQDIGMPMLLIDEELQRLGIVFAGGLDAAVPRLLDDRPAARFTELEDRKRARNGGRYPRVVLRIVEFGQAALASCRKEVLPPLPVDVFVFHVIASSPSSEVICSNAIWWFSGGNVMNCGGSVEACRDSVTSANRPDSFSPLA